ncbi:SDR family oxidoreductase [Oxalobacteraceae bacterium CAVE-383]|nr:SDR family oxidoreductase [Oxalobacteraceae bacterium CAVE-383]
MHKVLVLGASGMLGSAMLQFFSQSSEYSVQGSIRSLAGKHLFPAHLQKYLIVAGDIENHDALTQLFRTVRPSIVINCIGLIKQLAHAGDPLSAIPVNALLPHRIANLCALAGARMVHISTDCVFSGRRGLYKESDFPDAEDLYGRTKLLGEVDYPHAITLRTSIIGHELSGANGLVGWFLQQEQHCNGYTKAIFSGLPTDELARLIHDFILPKPDLHGLFHVASSPISKFELLRLIANVYQKQIDIRPDDKLVIDRSLNADRIAAATKYTPLPWRTLIENMHRFQKKSRKQA